MFIISRKQLTKTNLMLVKQIKESLGEHDQILLKGSNSMNLAKVVEELQAKN